MTFRTAMPVFAHGLLRINAQDRCDRKQPGQTISEFFADFFRIVLAQGLRQFADFLNQPIERFIQASFAVFAEIDVRDQFLI